MGYIQRARQLRPIIEKAAESLSDDDAIEAVELFPIWEANTAYTTDERVQYGDKLYRCVQSHTSQADWTPDATPALWTEVAKPGEIPVWKQPTGAQDAYMTGEGYIIRPQTIPCISPPLTTTCGNLECMVGI